MKTYLIKSLTSAAIGASWIYVPIFAKNLGISNPEIGAIVGLYAIALFFSSYVFGRASDRYGRKLFVLAGLGLSTIAFFLPMFAFDFLALALARFSAGFCVGIFQSSLTAYVYDQKTVFLSKFVSFGSLGWTFGALIAGAIAIFFSVKFVFVFCCLLFFLSYLTASRIKFGEQIHMGIPKFPMKIIRRNFPLYISILIRHTGANLIWTFWPLYLQTLGADLFWVGFISVVNTMTSFIFIYTLRGMKKYKNSIMAGLLLSGVTFFSFTLATDFRQIIPTQILLGISWSLMYLGGLMYLMKKNIEKATVSGLLDSVLSLSQLTGPLIATFVIMLGGHDIIMYLASTFAFTSFFLFRFSNQSK